MFLLDVNVLFTALDKPNASYRRVIRWLESVDRYATCGMTQINTFRLLLTPSAMRYEPLTVADAHAMLARFTNTERHTFIPCPELSRLIVGRTHGHNAAIDDYLVQIASAAGCRLATLDRALAGRWPERAHLV